MLCICLEQSQCTVTVEVAVVNSRCREDLIAELKSQIVRTETAGLTQVTETVIPRKSLVPRLRLVQGRPDRQRPSTPEWTSQKTA